MVGLALCNDPFLETNPRWELPSYYQRPCSQTSSSPTSSYISKVHPVLTLTHNEDQVFNTLPLGTKYPNHSRTCGSFPPPNCCCPQCLTQQTPSERDIWEHFSWEQKTTPITVRMGNDQRLGSQAHLSAGASGGRKRLNIISMNSSHRKENKSSNWKMKVSPDKRHLMLFSFPCLLPFSGTDPSTSMTTFDTLFHPCSLHL